MYVKQITSKKSIEHWCKYRHYAGTVPNYSFCFGLFDIDLGCLGVCIFGTPANYTMNNIFHPYKCIELQRLSLGEVAPRNYASILVSRSLKKLPKPIFVVSYADTNQGHVGYIYQATNWIYTGVSSARGKYWYRGAWRHSKTAHNMLGPDMYKHLIKKNEIGKHRYFYLVGSKKQCKKMQKMLENKFPTLPYPKGATTKTEIKDKNKLGLRGFFK